MKRILALLMMATLVLVNGTALAAAICVHEDAAAHGAALHSDDAGEAVTAHLEDAAGAAASKRAALADSGSLLLPAFVLPEIVADFAPPRRALRSAAFVDDPMRLGRAPAPLLEPPAA